MKLKKYYLISYSLIALAIIFYFINLLFYLGFSSIISDLENFWPILSLIFPGIFIYLLLNEKSFDIKWRSSLNLFSAGISLSVLAMIILEFFSIMTKNIGDQGETSLGLSIIAFLVIPLIGIIISTILGIIGFFIGKYTKDIKRFSQHPKAI